MKRRFLAHASVLFASSLIAPTVMAWGLGDRDPLLYDLGQYNFFCNESEVNERGCWARFAEEIDLHDGSRFVIHYFNARASTSGDESNPRDFFFSINYGNYGAIFAATPVKRNFLGDRVFTASEKVLLVVDEIGSNLPEFSCVADRPNQTGESFGCSFVVTGRFVRKP